MKRKTNFLETKESAKDFIDNQLVEMPHFQTPRGNYYDLYLEFHTKDTPKEFLNYIINYVKEHPSENGSIIDYIVNESYVKLYVNKYFGDKVYNKMVKELEKLRRR